MGVLKYLMYSDMTTLRRVPIPLSGGKKRMAWPVSGCRNSTVIYVHHIRLRVYSPKQKKSLDHTKYAQNRLLFKVCTEIHTKKSSSMGGVFSDKFEKV